jgi:hypothetical protein
VTHQQTRTTTRSTTRTTTRTTTKSTKLTFPQRGNTFVNANGRAFGWSAGANGAVSDAETAIANNAWYIAFINSPAVDIPEGTLSSYKGKFTIYNRGPNDAMDVLACTGTSQAPRITTTFKGDFMAGSWSYLPVSTNTFLLQCSTQYSTTNMCVSLPTSGSSPVLAPCSKTDKQQIFSSKDVDAFGK